VLEVRSVSQTDVVQDISFVLHRGEVLGVSGLMGSGRTELTRILFGLDPCERGEIILQGAPLTHPSPAACIERGMVLLTEDRREDGLLMDAPVAENIALASLRKFTRGPIGVIDHQRLRKEIIHQTAALGIECPSIERQTAKTLSGGNQQKAVLAKWMLTHPSVFILDEPTRGVDVGAKHEIYRMINTLVTGGAGVLLISSELEELTGMCDRILVMARGALRACIDKADFDQETLLRAALQEEHTP
jgi:ribose transport system ATP-binding protein